MGRLEVSERSLGLLNEVMCKAQEETIKARRELRMAEDRENSWRDLRRYLEIDWPFHALELLKREETLFAADTIDRKDLVEALEEIRTKASDRADQKKKKYPWLLDDASKETGMPMDITSRHPRYEFQQHFFWVEIDETKWTAKLFDYEGKLGEIPADIEAIVGALKKEKERVFDRPFDQRKVLARLRRQYLALIKKSGKRDGDIVPIRQITHRLGKNVKGFRTDEFLIDLSRLVQQGEQKIDSRRLELQQTRDPEQGMLLHGPAGSGYIGFVIFREA